MTSILVLTHEYDDFVRFPYLIKGLFGPWQEMNHKVRVVRGIPNAPDADVVIVHTDLSVVPEEYVRFAAQFSAGVNRNATDIRKRLVSRALLKPGDEWDGPVIVKSDLNNGGLQEWRHNQHALQRNRLPRYPSVVRPLTSYPIYPSVKSVPKMIWSDAGLVVERFLPERDDKGYWLRCWVFFGGVERCNRFCCLEPVVKAANFIAQEAAPVPDELRAERARLGIDYGKFDFVVHDGKVVLLDANRTPTGAVRMNHYQERDAARLARGIDTFIGETHARER